MCVQFQSFQNLFHPQDVWENMRKIEKEMAKNGKQWQ